MIYTIDSGGRMSKCCKKTERSEEKKKQLLNRINRISGQVNGIKRWWKKILIVMTY